MLHVAGLCLAFAAMAAHAQSTGSSAPFIEDFTSHIYKLASQTPTDQNLKHLQMAAGFHIQRFASGLSEPRMLAVADDGRSMSRAQARAMS